MNSTRARIGGVRIGLLLLSLGLFQCKEKVRTHAWFAMDTELSLTLFGKSPTPDDTVFSRVDKEARRLENLFSDFSSESGLSLVKGKIGDTVLVDAEIYRVLGQALEMAKVSHGAFDITLHDLKALWGIGGNGKGTLPGNAAIDSLMRNNPVYGASWELDSLPLPLTLLSGNRVQLHRSYTNLDLGAIAKGYTVDKIHQLLDSLGCGNHILMAGGEIRLGGHKAASPWVVGIRHPRIPDSLCGLIRMDTAVSISTSGDYERFFILDGVRYHHLFDPRSGYPVRGPCAVTVMLKAGSMVADALSTSLFVMGPEKGTKLATQYHATAVWFFERPEGLCAMTMAGFEGRLTLTGIPACSPTARLE